MYSVVWWERKTNILTSDFMLLARKTAVKVCDGGQSTSLWHLRDFVQRIVKVGCCLIWFSTETFKRTSTENPAHCKSGVLSYKSRSDICSRMLVYANCGFVKIWQISDMCKSVVLSYTSLSDMEQNMMLARKTAVKVVNRVRRTAHPRIKT